MKILHRPASNPANGLPTSFARWNLWTLLMIGAIFWAKYMKRHEIKIVSDRSGYYWGVRYTPGRVSAVHWEKHGGTSSTFKSSGVIWPSVPPWSTEPIHGPNGHQRLQYEQISHEGLLDVSKWLHSFNVLQTQTLVRSYLYWQFVLTQLIHTCWLYHKESPIALQRFHQVPMTTAQDLLQTPDINQYSMTYQSGGKFFSR